MGKRPGFLAVGGGFASVSAALALVTYALRGSTPAPVRPPAQPVVASAPAEAGGSARDDGPRPAPYVKGTELLGAYLGRELTSGGTASGDSTICRAHTLDALIVTVPDPYESHLDWAYDSYVEAVRRAYEASGFVIDRFWMPSRDSTVRVGRGSGNAAAGSALPDSTGSVRTRLARDVFPGVLLFRSSRPDERELRLIYIVGEIPTGGVQKAALINALDERQRLLARFASCGGAPSGPRRSTPMWIVGPSFSGSAASLRRVLDAWLDGHGIRDSGAVHVVSGAATSLANVGILSDSLTHRIRFSATVNPDQALLAVLERAVLAPMHIKASQVALVHEGTTQYGQALATDTTGDEGRMLAIPFPMNISALRSEYARNPDPANAAPGALSSSQASRVPLSLQDAARPRESPAVLSQMTPAAVDLVIDEMTRTLETHDVKAVGILATDVRDKLFLAEQVKRRLHDVQLFTLESHVLYRRAELNQYMRGMLVFSTYPLILENQWWVARRPLTGPPEALAFSNDAAQGVFNATLIALGHGPQVVEYGLPSRASDTVNAARAPPVWVTAVGAHSFVPMAAFADSGSSLGYVQRVGRLTEDRPRPDEHAPISFLAFGITFLLGLTIAGMSLWLIREELNEFAAGRDTGWVDALADPNEKATARTEDETPSRRSVENASLLIHQRLYTVLLLISACGLFLPHAVVMLLSSSVHGIFRWLSITGFTLLALTWTAALAIGSAQLLRLVWRHWRVGTRYAWRERWGTPWRRMTWRLEVVGRAMVAAGGLFYLVVTIQYSSWLTLWAHREYAGPLAFFHRSLELDSGMSPIAALMLAAAGFGVWGAWHLKRVSLLLARTPYERVSLDRETRHANLPDQREGVVERGTTRVDRAVRQVRDRLFLLIPDDGALILLGVLIALLAWLLPQFVRSAESIVMPPGRIPSSFDLLLRFGVLGAIVGTAWAVYRLLSVWNAFQTFLSAIASTPLLTPLERLPPRVSRLTRLTLFSGGAQEEVGSIADLQLHHLRNIFSSNKATFHEFVSNVPDLPARLDKVMDAEMDARESMPESTASRDRRRALELYVIHEANTGFWQAEPTGDDIKALASDFPPRNASQAIATTNTISLIRRTFDEPARVWLRVAEEFESVQLVVYIEWVLRHLRRLALFLLSSLLITTALLSSYPFQPESVVKLVFFLILAAAIASLVMVMTQMNRDEVLSRITNTDPGHVNWDSGFVLNLVIFCAVPLLALISSEFPTVRNALFSWVEPLLKTIAGS